jgi:hypothetical protein
MAKVASATIVASGWMDLEFAILESCFRLFFIFCIFILFYFLNRDRSIGDRDEIDRWLIT